MGGVNSTASGHKCIMLDYSLLMVGLSSHADNVLCDTVRCFNGLVQERRNSIAKPTGVVFPALTHRINLHLAFVCSE